MPHPLYIIAKLLEDRNIHFFTNWDGRNTFSLFVTLVGKRIEIYVNEDGEIDFSVFRGNEDLMTGQDALMAELDAD